MVLLGGLELVVVVAFEVVVVCKVVEVDDAFEVAEVVVVVCVVVVGGGVPRPVGRYEKTEDKNPVLAHT